MSTPVSPEERLERLRKEIAEHDARYYRDAAPVISDFEYDCLKAELKALESAFPDAARADSPTNAVGDDRSRGFEKVRHRVPMQSLDNTYSEGEFLAFCARAEKELPQDAGTPVFLVEPKIDGLSVSYVYENGKFARALTRGNGVEGDDISRHAAHIAGVPAELRPAAGKPVPEFVEIRGEIFMRTEEFLRINALREAEGLEPFANPRNLAAGTVKSQDPEETVRRRLDTFVYGLGACEPAGTFASLSELRETLRAWGFPLTDFCAKVSGGNAAAEKIRELGELRKSYAIATDGAVVNIDSLALQRTRSNTRRNRRKRRCSAFVSKSGARGKSRPWRSSLPWKSRERRFPARRCTTRTKSREKTCAWATASSSKKPEKSSRRSCASFPKSAAPTRKFFPSKTS